MAGTKSKRANNGDRPARGRCSLCGCDLAGLEAVEEIRPTRSDGEAWQYCRPCWAWASRPVPDDRDMVTRYVVFLKGLLGIWPYCDWITSKLAGRDQPAETRPEEGPERSDDGKDTTETTDDAEGNGHRKNFGPGRAEINETTDDAEGNGHCDPEAPGHERHDAQAESDSSHAEGDREGKETVSLRAEPEASGAR